MHQELNRPRGPQLPDPATKWGVSPRQLGIARQGRAVREADAGRQVPGASSRPPASWGARGCRPPLGQRAVGTEGMGCGEGQCQMPRDPVRRFGALQSWALQEDSWGDWGECIAVFVVLGMS